MSFFYRDEMIMKKSFVRTLFLLSTLCMSSLSQRFRMHDTFNDIKFYQVIKSIVGKSLICNFGHLLSRAILG